MFKFNKLTAKTGLLDISIVYLFDTYKFANKCRWVYKVAISKANGQILIDVQITVAASTKHNKISDVMLLELVQAAYSFAGHLDEYADVDLATETDETNIKNKNFYNLFASSKDGSFGLAETIYNLAECEDNERTGETDFVFHGSESLYGDDYDLLCDMMDTDALEAFTKANQSPE